MKKVIFGSLLGTSIALLITFIVIITAKSWSFDSNCVVYIERAANSNSVELAQTNLEKGTSYLEQHDITKSDRVEFLHKNLEAAITNLENVKNSSNQLEKSTVLSNVRVTLKTTLDTTLKSDPVSYAITTSPYAIAYLLWLIINIVAIISSCICFVSSLYDYGPEVLQKETIVN